MVGSVESRDFSEVHSASAIQLESQCNSDAKETECRLVGSHPAVTSSAKRFAANYIRCVHAQHDVT